MEEGQREEELAPDLRFLRATLQEFIVDSSIGTLEVSL
jgi:hypothetical protein